MSLHCTAVARLRYRSRPGALWCSSAVFMGKPCTTALSPSALRTLVQRLLSPSPRAAFTSTRNDELGASAQNEEVPLCQCVAAHWEALLQHGFKEPPPEWSVWLWPGVDACTVAGWRGNSVPLHWNLPSSLSTASLAGTRGELSWATAIVHIGFFSLGAIGSVRAQSCMQLCFCEFTPAKFTLCHRKGVIWWFYSLWSWFLWHHHPCSPMLCLTRMVIAGGCNCRQPHFGFGVLDSGYIRCSIVYLSGWF